MPRYPTALASCQTDRSPASRHAEHSPALFDRHGRKITYLRLSVTDRCNLRCRYCMAGRPKFRPKRELLTLEEAEQVCAAFIRLGVRKLRLTGGEPLLRRGVAGLCRALGRYVGSGALDELTLTTNGGHLGEFAAELFDCGVRRINVSLDTLEPAKFRDLTGGGNVRRTIDGMRAARAAGLRVKVNAVALAHGNLEDLGTLVGWCGTEGFDLTLIELMPIASGQRFDFETHHVPMTVVRRMLERQWTLIDDPLQTGGPATYTVVQETGGMLGFISPLARNFCDACNRVRVTATGQLVACLGHAGEVDLKAVLRAEGDGAALDQRIRAAIHRKPRTNHFADDSGASTLAAGRTMNVTGG